MRVADRRDSMQQIEGGKKATSNGSLKGWIGKQVNQVASFSLSLAKKSHHAFAVSRDTTHATYCCASSSVPNFSWQPIAKQPHDPPPHHLAKDIQH